MKCYISHNRFIIINTMFYRHPSETLKHICDGEVKVSKGAKIRNRYNQVPHLTQDTNGKVTNSQLDTSNECQEISPFPAGDPKAHINRRAQRHSKRKTKKNIKNPQKRYRLGTVSNIFYWRALSHFTAQTSSLIQMWIKTHRYLVCMKDP